MEKETRIKKTIKMDITKGIPFTTDCCGKEDLDFNIISVDTRYWRDMTAMCTF